MKAQSPHQLYVQEQLVAIGGRPQEIVEMDRLGMEVRIWVWDVTKNKKSQKNRTNLLILADKARDLSCDVFLISRIRTVKTVLVTPRWSNTPYASKKVTTTIEIVDQNYSLESVNRVVVWCPKTPRS